MTNPSKDLSRRKRQRGAVATETVVDVTNGRPIRSVERSGLAAKAKLNAMPFAITFDRSGVEVLSQKIDKHQIREQEIVPGLLKRPVSEIELVKQLIDEFAKPSLANWPEDLPLPSVDADLLNRSNVGGKNQGTPFRGWRPSCRLRDCAAPKDLPMTALSEIKEVMAGNLLLPLLAVPPLVVSPGPGRELHQVFPIVRETHAE